LNSVQLNSLKQVKKMGKDELSPDREWSFHRNAGFHSHTGDMPQECRKPRKWRSYPPSPSRGSQFAECHSDFSLADEAGFCSDSGVMLQECRIFRK
jgi:hypothetical protein